MKSIVLISTLVLLNVNCFAQHSTETQQYYKVTCQSPDGKKVVNEDIQIYSLRLKKSTIKTTDENGSFSVMLPYGWWKFSAVRFGVKNLLFLSKISGTDTATFSQFCVAEPQKGRKYNDIELSFVYEWKNVEIDVKYAAGSSKLSPESNKVLDGVVEYLLAKPNINILIGGHTDNIGDNSKNLELSQARAEEVKLYLIKSGIDENRISAKGYGDTQPIASNNDEQGRAKNRRTEMSVLQ